METILRVTLGADHNCARSRCPAKLLKGTVAVRRTRTAVTYYERCHADGRGNVSFYYCEKHAPEPPK